MKIALVFDPDPELGPDPLDPHKRDRRIGEWFDSEKADVVLLIRQYSDEFEDGYETQVWSSGIWENVDGDQIEDVLQRLSEL